MINAGRAIRRTGLKHLRLVNLGVFCTTEAEFSEAIAVGEG
jgi:hypothetical protein